MVVKELAEASVSRILEPFSNWSAMHKFSQSFEVLYRTKVWRIFGQLRRLGFCRLDSGLCLARRRLARHCHCGGCHCGGKSLQVRYLISCRGQVGYFPIGHIDSLLTTGRVPTDKALVSYKVYLLRHAAQYLKHFMIKPSSLNSPRNLLSPKSSKVSLTGRQGS